MSAIDGAVSVTDKQGRHIHAQCGHLCDCFTPRTNSCIRCRADAVDAAVRQHYHEDSFTTEQLLERRA